jgi:KaiC/GvpD/RAD55 family RecA-like ATPase
MANNEIPEDVMKQAREIGRAKKNGRRAVLTNADDTKTERPHWLCEPFFPSGVISLVAGEAGVGKSTLVIGQMSNATVGNTKGDYEGKPITVIFTAPEDSDSMQKARLLAAGADVKKIEFLKMQDVYEGEGLDVSLSLPEDIDKIEEVIKEKKAQALVIDPITSVINGDTNNRDDVRAALDPLAKLAQRLNISVIGVLHFNKGAGRAGEKLSGSHSFRDICRSLLVVAKDDKTGQHILTINKSSYSQEADKSWEYELSSVAIEADDGQEMTVPKVTNLKPTDVSVNDIINRNQNIGGGAPTAAKERESFIVGVLEDNEGWMRVAEVKQLGKDEAGYSDRELTKAVFNSEKISSKKIGAGKESYSVWYLPAQVDTTKLSELSRPREQESKESLEQPSLLEDGN